MRVWSDNLSNQKRTVLHFVSVYLVLKLILVHRRIFTEYFNNTKFIKNHDYIGKLTKFYVRDYTILITDNKR